MFKSLDIPLLFALTSNISIPAAKSLSRKNGSVYERSIVDRLVESPRAKPSSFAWPSKFDSLIEILIKLYLSISSS